MIQQIHQEAQGAIQEAHGAIDRENKREAGWKLKSKKLSKQSEQQNQK